MPPNNLIISLLLELKMRPSIQEEEEELKFEEDVKPPKKYLDSSMYKAAREGNFSGLKDSVLQNNGGNREEQTLLDRLLLETPKGNNLVHIAAGLGHEHFIQQVLQKCPQLACKPNSRCDTPLHVAAQTCHFDIVKVILSEAKRHKETATTDTPCTRQMKEMEDGGPAGVKNSLLRMKNRAGNTALHKALRNGNEEMGMLLWEADREMVGSVNEAGESVLYVAAELGLERVVKKMVEFLGWGMQREGGVLHGALSGPDGQNPLHAAVLAGSIGCVHALINLQGSKIINETDNGGRTALHFAAEAKQKEIATLLLQTDPSLAYTRDLVHGRTPLLEAAVSGHLCILREILKYCPDTVEISDNEGRNVVHLALGCGRCCSKEVLKVPELVELVNEADRHGDTPLHVAAKQQSYKIVKRLLMIPWVDLRAKNADGLTALDICEAQWQFTEKKAYLYRYLKYLPAVRSQKPHILNHLNNHLTPLDKPEADLKGHANTLCVIATLLTTITFAAAFTLPGGFMPDDSNAHPQPSSPSCNFRNSSELPHPMESHGPKSHARGDAVLIDRPAFKVFILADVLAVSTSLTVIFILISVMLSDETFLKRAIVYSKKLLYLALGGTMVTYMTGLFSVIRGDDSKWLAIAVCVIGSSVPLLIKYFQVKCFTSTPVFLHGYPSKKSSKKQMVIVPSCFRRNERVGDKYESFDDVVEHNKAPHVQLPQLSMRIMSGRSK